VNKKRMTPPNERRREIKTSPILIKQGKTKIQKFGPNKDTPGKYQN
jgi:hypothetical protein